MPHYWVVGGEYQSTDFQNLAPGTQETRLGPFQHYDEALKEWQRMAWETVDNALCHFHIEQDQGDANAVTYWVVGGVFSDQRFEKFSKSPERYGPFAAYEEAEAKWKEKAWQTVDDATAMYRIEGLQPQEEPAEQMTAPNRLVYRLITGPDDSAFCERVSQALEQGYHLYGQPSMTTCADGVKVAQAVVLPEFEHKA